MKIALVYDRVNKIGGAERILTVLHELCPDAPLYTLVYDKKRALWAKGWDVKTSFLQTIPLARTYHEFFPLIPVFAFEMFDFTAYDVVISVTATEAKGIITSPHTLHICYLLTPTRYLWSHYETYFANRSLRYLSSPVVSWLRIWDLVAAKRPDVLVTISNTVRDRIKKYYQREAEVIYPPVDVKKFTVHGSRFTDKRKNNYFLIVSRLVRYKRIDLAIEACNRLNLPLKIIGEGMERKYLEKISGPMIEFLGNLTDNELSAYYQDCRALLIPQEEDFGLVAIEALCSGRPVIAYAQGGVGETIIPGKNGELFEAQTSDGMMGALEKFSRTSYSREFCQKSAEKFDSQVFKKKFTEFIEINLRKFKKQNNI